MRKDNDPQITISNCAASRRVGAKESDLDQTGDNSFHCPVTGTWVNLKKGSDGEVICSDHGCDHMPIWLS